jgi:hypothetical protein
VDKDRVIVREKLIREILEDDGEGVFKPTARQLVFEREYVEELSSAVVQIALTRGVWL